VSASWRVDKVRSSTGRAFAGLVLVVAIAGCGGSSASPSPSLGPSLSPSLNPTASPTFTATPTPSPKPTPTPTPTFVATGNMKHPRMDATATLLTDGKVLIAGGSPNEVLSSPVLASAELYDPATGKFTPTGSMTAARSGATATLLPDGRVLIAGGYGCLNTRTCSPNDTSQGGGALASAEMYDPATGKFSRTGSMSAPRYFATATLLPEGGVLLLNGGDSSAEMYDPASGKFTHAGALLGFYNSSTATLLPSGKVLVVGPTLSGPTAELYDPASGKSTSISLELPSGAEASAKSKGLDRVSDTATLLKDGRVLLCVIGYLVTYDGVTGSFTQSGSISAPAQWLEPSTMLLPDGRVLFAGGYLESPDSTGLGQVANGAASGGLYDPASGKFTPVSSMNSPRAGHTATLLSDGTVLIAGGTADQENALASAELFKP
jgi:hypothetical protein